MYLGAVLKKELNSIAKRKRTIFFRVCVPGGAMLFIFLWLSTILRQEYRVFAELSIFGRMSFFMLSYILMFAGTFLAPGYTAPLLCTEREGKTLEIIASTPIRYFDLVLGKASSRVLFLMMVTLSAVPLMFVCLMFGGVSPREIILVSCLLMSNILICSGLGLLISSFSARSSKAIAQTYILLIIAGIASSIIFGVSVASFMGTGFFGSFGNLGVFGILAFPAILMNPYIMLALFTGPTGGWIATTSLPWIISASSGAVFFIVCVLISSSILKRTTYLPERGGLMKPIFGSNGMINPSRGAPRRNRMRHIRRNPVYWKECIESFLSSPSTRPKAIFFVLIPFFLLYVFSLMGWHELWFIEGSRGSRHMWSDVRPIFHTLFLMGELAIVFFYVIGASSNAFSKERTKKTLDALMATQLENKSIWLGKYFGVCRKAAALMLVPVLHLTLCVLHGVVPLRVPFVIITVSVVLLCFFTSVGISFSVKCAKRISSIMGTLLSAFFIFAIIPASAGFLAMIFSFGNSGSEEGLETIISLSPWWWLVTPLFNTELEEYWEFGIGFFWYIIIYMLMTLILSYTTAKPLRNRLSGAK